MTNPYFIEGLGKDNRITGKDFEKGLELTGQGIAAGAGSMRSNNYAYDPASIGTGVASGFATGGPIGGAAAFATSVYGQTRDIQKNLDNTQTSFEGTSYDGYGQPVYNGQSISQGFDSIAGLEKGAKSANKLMGLGAGAVFAQKKRKVAAGINAAQNQYNTANVAYRRQNNQMEDYQQRNNSSSRYYNLLRSQY